MKTLHVAALLALIGAPLLAQSQETEPNDSPGTAQPVTRGSSVRATIAPFNQATAYRDQDYFVLSANAGDTIFVDVDADEFGSHMNMGLTVYASDGTTMLTSNNDWDGVDPHIEYVAPTTGRYYVLTGTSLETTPWVEVPYTINFFQVKCPTTLDPEPNNTAATATSATLGQTIHGRSCPGGDVDFYRFDLDPGTVEFKLALDPHEHPAFGSAVEITGRIALYAPDGTTEIGTAQSGATDSPSPSRIEYTVRTRGTYFLRATMYPGGIRYTYTITSRLMSGPVPGDPITTRADVAAYWHDDGAVFDRNGDIIVSDMNSKSWRISPGGAKTRVAADVEMPAGLAWDAEGNLLIVNAAAELSNPSTKGGVFKLSPSGQLTRFITDDRAVWDIAMARDGSLWLAAWFAKALLHYDGQGNLIAAYDVSAVTGSEGPRHLALGPSGDPYFSTVVDIYRLHDGRPERVIHYDRTPSPFLDIASFAFDVQGNIYVANAAAGVINLHDGTGRWLQTISYEPTAPTRAIFGRNPDGSTNARLYAIDSGKLIEFNPAGVRAPGLPLQFDKQQAQDPAVEQAVTDLLKGGVLSDAQRRHLDQRGNQNGRYDVGDLRALLIRAGTISASRTH